MKLFYKRMLLFWLCIISFSLFFFGGCTMFQQENNSSEEIQANNINAINEFYETASESKRYLDIVAEDVYSYWYDAIYNDKYNNDIDYAILYALEDNQDYIDKIEANDSKLNSLYKELRDGKLSTEIKAVMTAYLDYYEFAINVSGSFSSYKENIDPLQKEYANALRALQLEL